MTKKKSALATRKRYTTGAQQKKAGTDLAGRNVTKGAKSKARKSASRPASESFAVATEVGKRSNSGRDICIFARQNLIHDPPFSKLDLVCCRNVMIYMESVIQRKLIPIFHYALNPTGYLMLGNSETVGAFSDLFAQVDKKFKLYAKKSALAHPSLKFAPFDVELNSASKPRKDEGGKSPR